MRNRIGPWCGLIAFLAAALASPFGVAQTWTEHNKGKVRPPVRYFHAMAYDAARQRVVLFGGAGNMTGYGDTWEWDGSDWTQRIPATSPSARSYHAMAYDAARQRVVLFGGTSMLGFENDTWEWDGKIWTQRKPAVSPPARNLHAMAYDSARKFIVLFGGNGCSGNDTWEWDGNNWTQRKPTTIPLCRVAHAMAYDAARQRTLLFAGYTSVVTYADTWEWDGKDWTQRTPATHPSARGDHGLVCDWFRQRVILFGGANPRMFNDTWEWDGSDWTQQAPASSPSVRNQHAMAYDSGRQRIVLFGGQLSSTMADNETWEYGFAATMAASGTPRPGATVNLVLTAANDAGLFYQAGSSLGTGPILVGNRRIGLSPDLLLQVSAGNLWPWIFTNYRGTLDQRGQAAPAIHFPNLPALIGTRIHTAFLTLDPAAPSGIRSISDTLTFSVTK